MEMIEKGEIPLTEAGNKWNMSADNPYNAHGLKEPPKKIAIEKAVETYKIIFGGNDINDIKEAKTFCTGESSKVVRSIGMLALGLDRDAFLIFLGSVRDKQFNG
jgi:hypothetical protein